MISFLELAENAIGINQPMDLISIYLDYSKWHSTL